MHSSSLYFLIPLLFCFLSPAFTEAQGLPANPNPNKCYVRVITPDIFETTEQAIFTYTEEDALLYPHKEVEITLSDEYSLWEYTPYEGCESDDPADCQVLCYRTYPTRTITFYEPVDTSLGDPYWDFYEVEELVERGGLKGYEEIDCELTSYNALPIDYAPGSAALSEEARHIIDERLLFLLEERPNIRVQINVHTASIGDSADNQRLTELRAEGIADYLISMGIHRSRLVTRGLGESQLKNRCGDGVRCSEVQHAINRRVEFRVLNMDM